MDKSSDVIAEMGLLTLGSRFKRLGDRLQGDVARFFADRGLDIPPSQLPLLVALERAGALTVGDLALALGVAQPGVTRTVGHLSERGLVEVARGEDDQRRRAVSLTPAGQTLVEESRRLVWGGVGAAVAEVCADLSGPLLEQLAGIEAALEAEPLDRRARRLVKDKP